METSQHNTTRVVSWQAAPTDEPSASPRITSAQTRTLAATGATVLVFNEARGEMPHGSETILLAEDEEMLRELAREVLEMNGYKVLPAANGASALQLCEQHEGPIHLLLTDVDMPEMSGRALAECLQRLRPGLRVLYMSGYTSDAIVHHGVLDESMNFIQKPFTPAALAQKVRAVLDS
jgi:CheY-like chemotaxis protein